MTAKILIVEDNLNLSTTLYRNLTECGVFRSADLTRAYNYLTQHQFEVVILDLTLNNGDDGLELLSYLKQHETLIKVLILSSKSEIEDKINGLSNGADDYLTKPFSLIELKLRIKNLISVTKNYERSCLKFKQLIFDLNNFHLYDRQDEKFSCQLQKKEGLILKCLMQNKNLAINKNTIINEIWRGDKIPLLSSIDVYIRRIRKKLCRYGQLIKTRKNIGYYFDWKNN